MSDHKDITVAALVRRRKKTGTDTKGASTEPVQDRTESDLDSTDE